MLRTRVLIPGLIVMALLRLSAQADNRPAEDGFSYLLADLGYISDAVFMGRRDTVAAPYLMPSVGYFHRSGVYANASLSFLLASGEQRVDLVIATGGYRFTGEKWSGDLSATAYFFNEDSYNVRSGTAADLTGMVGYDWGLVRSSLSLATFFNPDSNPDVFLGLTLRKDIMAAKSRLLIRPEISIYGGSQYFYEAYYNTSRLGNRKSGGQGPGSGGMTSTNDYTLEEVQQFRLLDVEVGLPVSYFSGRFIFNLYPTLAFPLSPATLDAPDFSYEESLDPAFYIMAGISYWVPGKRQRP